MGQSGLGQEGGPDLTLHLGTEVFYSNSMLDRELEQGQILTQPAVTCLGGVRLVWLIREIMQAIRVTVQLLAYSVVIAHISAMTPSQHP